MTIDEWTDARSPYLPAARPAAIRGYVQHALRTERTLGWILWIGLVVVMFVASL